MNSKKLKIEVFIPLGSCICHFAPLMEKVGRATSNSRDSLDIQVKSINSPEASKYEIQDIYVVVNGKDKLSSSFDEKELENIISEWTF
jgi:hypothetical protein